MARRSVTPPLVVLVDGPVGLLSHGYGPFDLLGFLNGRLGIPAPPPVPAPVVKVEQSCVRRRVTEVDANRVAILRLMREIGNAHRMRLTTTATPAAAPAPTQPPAAPASVVTRWPCSRCTYLNVPYTPLCEMCELGHRPSEFDPALAPVQRTCSICMDDFTAYRVPKNPPVFACGAEHPFCDSCMGTYLETKINDGVVLRIRCPESGCGKEATLARLLECELLSDKAKERLSRFSELQSNSDARQCSKCNTINYPKRGLFGAKADMTCTTCAHSFCFHHDNAHPGTKCSVYSKAFKKSEAESEGYKAKKSKKCPSCKCYTEKDQGCNRMSCSRCSQAWCWSCGGKMTDNHYAPWNVFMGCPMSQHVYNRAGVAAIRVGAGLGMIVAAALSPLLIPAAIIGLPIKAALRARRNRRMRRMSRGRGRGGEI